MARRSEIVENLRKKFLQNEFGPGESVPEESLAAEFSVSRTPIREALIVLEHQGLVTNEANRGFRVVSVSIESIRSYFETVKALYPTMFRIALSRAGKPEVQMLVAEGAVDAGATGSVLGHYYFLNSVAALARNDFMISATRSAEGYHSFVRASVLKNLPERVVIAARDELLLHKANVVDAMNLEDEASLLESIEQMIDGSRVFLISHIV